MDCRGLNQRCTWLFCRHQLREKCFNPFLGLGIYLYGHEILNEYKIDV